MLLMHTIACNFAFQCIIKKTIALQIFEQAKLLKMLEDELTD